MDDSLSVREDNEYRFDARLAHLHFIEVEGWFCVPLAALLFDSRSYSNIEDSSLVTKEVRKSGSF